MRNTLLMQLKVVYGEIKPKAWYKLDRVSGNYLNSIITVLLCNFAPEYLKL